MKIEKTSTLLCIDGRRRQLRTSVHEWRGKREFRRFNEPAPRALGAPSRATKNFRQENNRPTSEKLTTNRQTILFKLHDKLILRKIIKTVATRCHIIELSLKCTKFNFGWGSAAPLQTPWRGKREFRRFNEPAPRALGAPSRATKNFRQENNRPTSEKLTSWFSEKSLKLLLPDVIL